MTDGDTDARSLSQDAQEVLRVRAVKMLEEGLTQVEVAGLLLGYVTARMTPGIAPLAVT